METSGNTKLEPTPRSSIQVCPTQKIEFSSFLIGEQSGGESGTTSRKSDEASEEYGSGEHCEGTRERGTGSLRRAEKAKAGVRKWNKIHLKDSMGIRSWVKLKGNQ